MHRDRVFTNFLEHQHAEGLDLANASEILELHPVEGRPPSRYIAVFNCAGVVLRDGVVRESVEPYAVGITFAPDYLRRPVPGLLVWLGPPDAYHPNIRAEYGVVCIGRVPPGSPLVDLLHQLYEVITYQRVTMREDDALDADACAWARQHRHLFPVDARALRRPLRRAAEARP